MSLKDKEKWNAKYDSSICLAGREPSPWLVDHAHLLDGRGKALDIAMGEGRNTLFAASLGYDVWGVDISDVGVSRAESLARQNKLTIHTQIADLDHYKIDENTYDLILCFYFLDRRLFKGIQNGLKPGGTLVFETFTVDHLKYSSFKREWVLEKNELPESFPGLKILDYQEVDEPENETAYASLIARKEQYFMNEENDTK
ncbi:MAG: methyltransferase domain-containing protein [Nitrospinota bacterium]|nr:methyltransferase domain-containing protein [Nitrospinota bacterium]